MNTNVNNYMLKCLKPKFIGSQDKWKCDLILTYPPFKLNGLRTTGARIQATAVECQIQWYGLC